jgi:coniferyl-aldehyde dehydrogenase
MLKARLDLIVEDNNAKNNACGIINQSHIDRLNSYLEDAISKGGDVIRIGSEKFGETRNFPFYIIDNVTDEMLVMQEEIFGPIIPILGYTNIQDAISYINKGDKPLGLYVFSKNQSFIDKILNNTQSGGVVINAIALQAAQPALTFGGVGQSGMGRHHGIEGFREFSYPRGVFNFKDGGTTDWIMPPFDKNTRFLIEKVAYAPLVDQIKFALKRLPKMILGSK